MTYGDHRRYPGGRYPTMLQPLMRGPREPEPPADSFMVFHTGIEPGEKVFLDTQDMDEWVFGPHFAPKYFVYVGSPNLWLLKASHCNGTTLSASDLPCETYRPGCPTWVNWPTFSCAGFSLPMILVIENRGKEKGDFIARMAGEFHRPEDGAFRYPNPTGMIP